MKGRVAVDAQSSLVTVRSEAGDAVQLSDVRPVACGSLVRVGSANDGGYVVPIEAIEAADALLSFGLSHDWTFERDFRTRNPNAVIHCYDHTVSALTTLQYSLGQAARFAVRRKSRYLRRAFTFVDYPLFFRGTNVHFRQRIWSDRDGDSATIDDAFARLNSGSRVFVKMDIEGGEYRVLDDVLRHATDVVALTVEFHDVDILPSRFNALISAIKCNFHIVHIHGNNMGGVTPFHFPTSPEITFLNKRFFASVPEPSRLVYPVPGLDRPNHPDLPEFKFEF
jgi:hypothetical protein